MTDTATKLQAFDPFALPTAPTPSDADADRADAIGARHGFDVPEPTRTSAPAVTAKSRAPRKPKAAKRKPAPKPKAPEVRRMRTRTQTPKAQFNQRVPVDVANGFYDYQRETGLPMGVVLQRAYQALMREEAEAS